MLSTYNGNFFWCKFTVGSLKISVYRHILQYPTCKWTTKAKVSLHNWQADQGPALSANCIRALLACSTSFHIYPKGLDTLTHLSLETPERKLANSADPDQML